MEVEEGGITQLDGVADVVNSRRENGRWQWEREQKVCIVLTEEGSPVGWEMRHVAGSGSTWCLPLSTLDRIGHDFTCFRACNQPENGLLVV